jgi:hypothetical protein
MKLRLKAHVRKANVTEFDNLDAWHAACESRGLRIDGPSAPEDEAVEYAYRVKKTDDGRYLNEDGSNATDTEQLGMFDLSFEKGVLCETAEEFTKWMNIGNVDNSAWDADKGAF